MRVMGEVILYKNEVEVACIKLRAAGYECKVVPPDPLVIPDPPLHEYAVMMIWRDCPALRKAWNSDSWMGCEEACTVMIKFCTDVDDTIMGPHDDGRMEDPTYVGVVQTAGFVPDGFIPVFANDYGD